MRYAKVRRGCDSLRIQERSDEELLTCFLAENDKTAFEVLVVRYWHLMLKDCLTVLGHYQDAEDATQEAVLVAMEKVASIRKKKSIRSWLRGTAYRVAQNFERKRDRQRVRETHPEQVTTAGPGEVMFRELQTMVAVEVERLPDKLRPAFVLCCLEGWSKKEGADKLGWNEGTFSSCLARGRKLVQQRLLRRGIAPPWTRHS
jgi:RNA polymerase sigma factor (sigma-70 family)